MKCDRCCTRDRLIALFVLLLSVIGCQRDRASNPKDLSTTKPAEDPSQKTKTFDDKKAGIRFNYPENWTPKQGRTATFSITAPTGGKKGAAGLTLDVPQLPWHPPGMISPKRVADGYVDDLKKKEIPDAKVEEATDVKVAGAPARLVKTRGHKNGKDAIDVAIAIVHSDRVYIFSCDSDAEGYETARAALDAAVASVEWR